MSPQKFEIPAAYRDQLSFVEARDERSDEQILGSLSFFRPVTSEKNIWAFWHSGIRSMPPWCQRNVCSWVRMHAYDGWTVRVLDSTAESNNYFLKYVPESVLPDSFVRGKMDGPYVGPHSADMLRGACLYAHGGVFLDVGIPLIRSIDRVCWAKLEDPNTPYEIAAPWVYGTHIGNHFVSARKANPFIHRWHKLFCHLWEGHTNSAGLMKNPLMKILAEQPLDLERAQKFQWGISQDPALVDEYVSQVMCWNRVCLLEDAGDGFSGVDYWASKVLLWDGLEETWGAETTLGFKGCGQRMFDYFALPVDYNTTDENYEHAERLVWRLLSRSSMQKVFRGKALTHDKELGELWDADQDGNDCKKGTFGELFRYGCENFRQTRDAITYVKAPRPEKTYKKGLLEV
ncbi:hypothetical protein DM02DRAFT_599198 [Periconia macrospinosa]|uniref:Capsule polysaccharide biosynthesis protein n=1 Tax=Periconia macrospinosa TaxID=97972 RepID=A0A2V1DGW0_9PLEO|nr:hypothetical protein DM02DRAFT_599198 [Periconia macrospinosa]